MIGYIIKIIENINKIIKYLKVIKKTNDQIVMNRYGNELNLNFQKITHSSLQFYRISFQWRVDRVGH